MSDKQNVAILGASNKDNRYSYKALKMLQEHDHNIFPVHPVLVDIEGVNVYKSLGEIDESIDTLTVYVGPAHIGKLISEIVKMKPSRVILNPGTESEELMNSLTENQIPYLEACTLVMLRTNQF